MSGNFPYQAGKRIFDFSLACALLAPATFLILISMVFVRVNSPGNAIFRQVRVGKDQQHFVLLKLRTMRSDTENRPSHQIAASQITSIGKLLRKTKLDELPQIYSVLKGDMSFVGPRPCLPIQETLIAERASRGVFSVKPGITGPAQLREIDMSTPKKLAETDATYIQNMSFVTDIKYIFMTALGAGANDAVGKH